MAFGQGRLRRVKYAFVHVTGSKVSVVQRGRQGAVKPQMEKQLQNFGCFSVALEIREPEELTVEMVIERVSKAAIVDKEVLEGDSAGRNAFTVEAFREALAEERKMAESIIGRSEALQVTRAPGSELTLDDVVKLMRVPDGPMNWGGRADA